MAPPMSLESGSILYPSAAESPLRKQLDVSPVCIRQAVRMKAPVWKTRTAVHQNWVTVEDIDDEVENHSLAIAVRDVRGTDDEEEEEKSVLPVKSYVADNSCLKSPGKGVLYRKSKSFEDVAAKAGVTWGGTVKGTDAGDGWLKLSNGLFLPKKVNGMPVLLLTREASGSGAASGLVKKLLAQKETEEGFMFTVDVMRNGHGESGFSIWPDFMTVCCKDQSRPELFDMKDGDIVFAVDGFRTPTFEDYLKYASGINAFTVTMFRVDDPCAEVEQEKCTNVECGSTKCMVGAMFCPDCGTRRPQKEILI